MDKTSLPTNGDAGRGSDFPPARQSWFSRHAPQLVLGGIVLAIVLSAQWPMLKGMGYRLVGSTAMDDRIPWRSDLAAAQVESRQSGKPILMVFSATWCPPCQTMKHDVWPDEQVRQAVVNAYIPLAADVDAASSEPLALRYGISTIPAIVVVDAEGKVLKRGSYMSRDKLLEFLAHHRS